MSAVQGSYIYLIYTYIYIYTSLKIQNTCSPYRANCSYYNNIRNDFIVIVALIYCFDTDLFSLNQINLVKTNLNIMYLIIICALKT